MRKDLIAVLILTLAALFVFASAMSEAVPSAAWSVENAVDAFVSDIVVPDNAIQYKKELTAELTEEQAENFQEGIAVIYVPNVQPPDLEIAIQGICYLPVSLTEDAQLKAEFSGLYVAADEEQSENLQAQLITTRPVFMSRQDSLDHTTASLSLKGVFYGELDAMYNPFTISIDYADNTARIDSISLEESKREPLDGYYSAYRYTYVMDETTDLPHFLDMKSTAWTLWYEKKIETPKTIVLHPVTGTGCKVLFSITNKDGTSYSLAPVDYD